MTVYAELLKLTLADGDGRRWSRDELVSDALARREALAREGDAATRLACALAYDAALVRLCQLYGIDQELTGESPGTEARLEAEDRLGTYLPGLGAGVLG